MTDERTNIHKLLFDTANVTKRVDEIEVTTNRHKLASIIETTQKKVKELVSLLHERLWQEEGLSRVDLHFSEDIIDMRGDINKYIEKQKKLYERLIAYVRTCTYCSPRRKTSSSSRRRRRL